LRKLKKQALRAAEILRLPKDATFTISFVSVQKIRALNKKFFKKDRTTDVIALGYEDLDNAIKGDNYFGDIIIAPHVAKMNTKVFKTTFFSEVLLYIVHGILHLIGYDDIKKEDRVRMQKKEIQVISSLNL